MNYNWSFISTFSFILFPPWCFPFSRGPRSFWKEIRTVVNHRTSHRAVRSNFYPSLAMNSPSSTPLFLAYPCRVISTFYTESSHAEDNDSRGRGWKWVYLVSPLQPFRLETKRVENIRRKFFPIPSIRPFVFPFHKSLRIKCFFLLSLSLSPFSVLDNFPEVEERWKTFRAVSLLRFETRFVADKEEIYSSLVAPFEKF